MTKISDAVDVGAIRAKIEVDLSSYNTGMDRAIARTGDLGLAGRKAAQDLDKIGDTKDKITQLATSQEVLNAKIRVQQARLAELKKAYSETFDVSKKSKLDEKIVNTEASLVRMMQTSENTSKRIWDLEDKLAKASQAAAITGTNVKDLGDKLRQLGVNSDQVGALEKSLRKANPEILKRDIAEVVEEMKRMGASSSEIDKVTKQLENSAKASNTTSAAFKQVTVALGALSAAMTGLIVKSVNAAADFEQAMANVKAISQATGAEFEALRKQALDLGASTIFTASQAADAQALLAQAGYKTTDIIAAMPGVLALAAAGQTDLATTADITASALNGFGLAADETARVADVLAKSSIDTNADVTDLGFALKYVAPVAAAMGVSIEEAVAAIGELSNAGIKGEMAGTQLGAILLALSSPSKEAAFYMERLGVSIADSSGKIKPLGDIVDQMRNGFQRLTQAQQADAAATLVGREAASGFLTLLTQGRETLDGYTESLQNAGGTAEQVAGVQMDTFRGAQEQLRASLEAVGITIGDALIPAIRTIAEWITNLLSAFNSLDPSLQTFIATLLAVSAGVLGLVAAFGALKIALDALSMSNPILLAITLTVGALAATIGGLAAANNAASESARKFAEAQSELQAVLNKDAFSRSVEEVKQMQETNEKLAELIEKRTGLQEKLNDLQAQMPSASTSQAGSFVSIDPNLAQSIGEVQREIAALDDSLEELGVTSENADAKHRELNEAIEDSIPALQEMDNAETAALATQVQHIDSMTELQRQYTELSAKETLSAQEKQQLTDVVKRLVQEYPSLHAELQEEGRWHLSNVDIIDQLIAAEKDSVNAAAISARDRINIRKQETQAMIELARKQLAALEAVSGASGRKIENNNPIAQSIVGTPIGTMLTTSIENQIDRDIEKKQNKINDGLTLLNKLDQDAQDLTVGAFDRFGSGGGLGTGSGVDLTKPEKAKKAAKTKKGKSAAELAAEARKKAYDSDLATIRYMSDFYDWDADTQIKKYEELQKKHTKFLKESQSDARTLNLQLKRLGEDSAKSRYDFSSEWITKEERRMEESGKSETEIAQMKLDAWTRVRDRYAKDSDLYKQADEEVYRARKDLTTKTTKLTTDLVKTQKASIDTVKKAEIEAIKQRKQAALADYDARIKAIDELLAKEAELNSDFDYETQLREKNARIDLLGSAVGPEGIQEREDLIKERDRMILEHGRDLRKRELESQKTALKDEKDTKSAAFDAQISAAEAQYSALSDAFSNYSGDIKTIEAVLADFRVSEAGRANAQILTELDAFIANYNSKMAKVDGLNQNADLQEYNANKDAWSVAKSSGNTSEMARLSARNEDIRKQYGITKDTGKLQSFKVGGIVQGSDGEPVIIKAHAGEMVLNDRQQAVLWDAINGSVRVTSPSNSGGDTIIHNTFDMSVNDVTLEDNADIAAMYDERRRSVERLQTQGVKTR